eukprot:gene3803-2689_t
MSYQFFSKLIEKKKALQQKKRPLSPSLPSPPPPHPYRGPPRPPLPPPTHFHFPRWPGTPPHGSGVMGEIWNFALAHRVPSPFFWAMTGAQKESPSPRTFLPRRF